MKRFFFCFLWVAPLLATARYELPEKGQIVQFSVDRTGSTLIFNILNYLFEDTESKIVIKTHTRKTLDAYKCKAGCTFVVSTLREPLDQLASYILTYHLDQTDLAGLKRQIRHIMKSHRRLLRNVLKNNRTLLLNYDQMSKDFAYLFSELEQFFHIKITAVDKEEIQYRFSKATMKKIATQLVHFEAIDQTTGIHGNHIHDSFPGYWRHIIPAHLHADLERAAYSY